MQKPSSWRVEFLLRGTSSRGVGRPNRYLGLPVLPRSRMLSKPLLVLVLRGPGSIRSCILAPNSSQEEGFHQFIRNKESRAFEADGTLKASVCKSGC